MFLLSLTPNHPNLLQEQPILIQPFKPQPPPTPKYHIQANKWKLLNCVEPHSLAIVKDKQQNSTSI